AVGLSDLTPMIKYRVAGREAGAFLDRLLTRDVGRMKENTLRFAPFCDDAGAVVGSAFLHRLSQDEFLMVSEARYLPWLLDTAHSFPHVIVDDETHEHAIIGLHGVASAAALMSAGI